MPRGVPYEPRASVAEPRAHLLASVLEFVFAARLLPPLLAVATLPVSASPTQPPGPAADFPSLDSYYPPAAARAGQQGTAIIHFCVDATGKLTEPPTLAGTSGNEVLDAAAIDLATAGSGHYRPPREDGVPVRGCGNFRIAFKLRGPVGLPVTDPRFPTIGARIIKLDGEFTRRMQERISEIGHPLPLQEVLTRGGPAGERAIRQYARSFDSFIDETVGMTADFLDDVDYLGESPDIPESERHIFREEWPNNRSALVVQFREMIAAIRDVVRITDELGDYIAFSAPRRAPKDTNEAQTPPEDPQLNAIRERARVAVEKLQNALKSMGANPATAPQ